MPNHPHFNMWPLPQNALTVCFEWWLFWFPMECQNCWCYFHDAGLRCKNVMKENEKFSSFWIARTTFSDHYSRTLWPFVLTDGFFDFPLNARTAGIILALLAGLSKELRRKNENFPPCRTARILISGYFPWTPWLFVLTDHLLDFPWNSRSAGAIFTVLLGLTKKLWRKKLVFFHAEPPALLYLIISPERPGRLFKGSFVWFPMKCQVCWCYFCAVGWLDKKVLKEKMNCFQPLVTCCINGCLINVLSCMASMY